MDSIFTLMAFVQKQCCFNRKLYDVAFIDFDKGFDSINSGILWFILIKKGIRGKLNRCIMSTYDCMCKGQNKMLCCFNRL